MTLWGQAWFEHGCLSSHFRTMVFEGESVQASTTTSGGTIATIEATRPTDPGARGHDLARPRAAADGPGDREPARAPGELFILDKLDVGWRSPSRTPSRSPPPSERTADPFWLAEKLDRITEPSPWYTAEGAATSPWGRPIVPFEMLSVLANKSGRGFPVRGPALGLFLDLEVRMVAGPVFVDHDYELRRRVIGLSQSKRTGNWTETTVSDLATGELVAVVVLHQGVFKESYADYPKDLLAATR